MIDLREHFCRERMETINWDDIIFVDEAGFDLHTLPGHGRSHIGDRIRLEAPASAGPRLNMLVGISYDGIIHFVARYGSTDRDVYIRFLTSLKTNALELFKQKHVTIMQDGASIHQGDDVRDAVETGSSAERSCKLDTLPPHSSQLNPCEEFWSWLKHRIRVINAQHSRERLRAAEQRKEARKQQRQQAQAAPRARRARPPVAAAQNDDDSPAVRETEVNIAKQELLTTLNEAVDVLLRDQTLAASLCQSYFDHARRIWLDCVQRIALVE